MVEELIEGFVEGQGTWFAYVVVLSGAAVLTYSVEKLISYLVRAALGLGVSMFMLAVLFTGIEFDDTAVALVFGAGGLEEVALGTALGTALAITGITLAVAAIAKPFPAEIPRDYLLVFTCSPLVLVPFVLGGTLTLAHGIALGTVFLLVLGYIGYREVQRDTPVFRNSEIADRIAADGGVKNGTISTGDVDFREILEEIPEDDVVGTDDSGLLWVGLSLVALVGIILGAILLETGSEVLVEAWGIEETVFGATVLTLVLTFENLLLIVEPVRRGVPEIGVGHVIGSVIFSVTANVGVILLVAEMTIARDVLVFHLPAVIVLTAVAAAFIYTRRLRRWHGYTLGALYIAYWIVAIVVFGGVPLPD